MVRPRSETIRRGEGMTEMLLRVTGSSGGETDKLGCAAGQEGTTGFYWFLFDFKLLQL